MLRMDKVLRGVAVSTYILPLLVSLLFGISFTYHAAAQTLLDEGVPWQPTRTTNTIARTRAQAKPTKLANPTTVSSRLSTLPDPYSESWPNTVAICAIMFNETERDVLEFIDYYRWLGVDSFFIRENSDTSTVRGVLQPYIDAGILNFALAPGPKFPFQVNWYNECSKLAAKKHSWIAFIDLDEFMVILKQGKADTRPGMLKRVLHDRFRYNAAVSLQWVLFGSSGHKEPPEKGQLQGFQRCTGVLSKQMKCIGNTYWLNPVRVFVRDAVHQCAFRVGGIVALANGDPMTMRAVNVAPGRKVPYRQAMTYPGHMYPSLHKRYTTLPEDYHIIINHYVTRSQRRFVDRKIRIKAGVYATAYAEILRERGGRGSEDELFAAFEHSYGFDGDYPICHQGAAAGAAMREARAAGQWDPIDSQPGLLPKSTAAPAA